MIHINGKKVDRQDEEDMWDFLDDVATLNDADGMAEHLVVDVWIRPAKGNAAIVRPAFRGLDSVGVWVYSQSLQREVWSGVCERGAALMLKYGIRLGMTYGMEYTTRPLWSGGHKTSSY